MAQTIDIPARVIEERMREIDDAIKTLNAERASLRALIERAARGVALNILDEEQRKLAQGEKTSYVASIHPREGVPLTDQLVEYVRERPGLHSRVIAVSLVAGGFNRGRDPRKLIQTSLGALVAQGRIRKDAEGRHYPVE